MVPLFLVSLWLLSGPGTEIVCLDPASSTGQVVRLQLLYRMDAEQWDGPNPPWVARVTDGGTGRRFVRPYLLTWKNLRRLVPPGMDRGFVE